MTRTTQGEVGGVRGKEGREDGGGGEEMRGERGAGGGALRAGSGGQSGGRLGRQVMGSGQEMGLLRPPVGTYSVCQAELRAVGETQTWGNWAST